MADIFLKSDREYADAWLTEAASWERAGVYEKIAATLTLDNGDLHVDFGCGAGHLIRAIRARNPGGALLGVEINSTAAEHAQAGNLAAGMDSILYDCSRYRLNIGKKVKKVFEPDAAKVAEIRGRMGGDAVMVVVDDLRSMAVVRGLIGLRSISSATYTLPGSSTALVQGEVAVTMRISNEALCRVKDQISCEARKEADEMMTEQAEKDAVYTLTERLALSPRESQEEIIATFMEMRFGGLQKFWEVESCELIPLSEMPTIDRGGIGWRLNHLFRADVPSENIPIYLIVTKLRRNARRFERKSAGKKRR